MRKQGRERKNDGGPLGFTPLTGILGGAGLLAIVSGFYLLNQGSISLAPALLVLGYGILLPLALVK